MHFDASRSLAELGLIVRPVRESLADAVAWLGDRPAARPVWGFDKTRELSCNRRGA